MVSDKRCKGRIRTKVENGEFLTIETVHCHDSSAANVEVARRFTKIKERAVATQEIPSQIINECSQNIPLSVQGIFPRHNVIRQVIQRTRTAYNAVPVQPINRESIELPESFTLYEKFPNHFEKFLLADSGLGDHD